MDIVALAPIVLLVVAFYFLLIRPQKQRQRQQAEMVSALAPGAQVITCLLYTSPSPRDRTRSRMPSSA